MAVERRQLAKRTSGLMHPREAGIGGDVPLSRAWLNIEQQEKQLERLDRIECIKEMSTPRSIGE